MTGHFAKWQQATRDAHAAQPGARALMVALTARFIHARSWGIYSARNTVLGNLSAHSEGRALDVGCSSGTGEAIVRYLLALPYVNAAGERRHGPAGLGISVIIHNRRIYSAKSPAGRPYSGDPHTDHVHIELTRKAAAHLSLKRARRLLSWNPPK